LARSTQGFSGADIAEIVTSASKLAIREAIMATEERKAKIESGEVEDDGAANEIAGKMLIGKSHFNFAMSRARRSVSEKDLVLYQEFSEKQQAGRGEAATNFKFGSAAAAKKEEDDDSVQEDLYS
jgi:transitional endoplasmic reticulum ATPase